MLALPVRPGYLFQKSSIFAKFNIDAVVPVDVILDFQASQGNRTLLQLGIAGH